MKPFSVCVIILALIMITSEIIAQEAPSTFLPLVIRRHAVSNPATPTTTPSPAPCSVTIRLVTHPSDIRLNYHATTAIYADGIPEPGLGSWQTNITYDPTVLEISEIVWGTDLYSTGRIKFLEIVKTDRPGEILMAQTTWPGPDGPTGDDLHLASVVWQGTHYGVSELKLTPAMFQSLSDSNLDKISNPLTLVHSRVWVYHVSPIFHSPTPTLTSTTIPAIYSF